MKKSTAITLTVITTLMSMGVIFWGAKKMFGEEPILKAIARNDIVYVRDYLDKGGNPNWQAGENPLIGRKAAGWSPLKQAALYNRQEIAQLLLDRGADINLRAGIRSTALKAAIQGGHLDMVKFLVERGALVDQDIIDWAKADQIRSTDLGDQERLARHRTEIVNYLKRHKN